MSELHPPFRAVVYTVIATAATLTVWFIAGTWSASKSADLPPARIAMRGECLSRIVQCRTQPIEIGPILPLRQVVSEDDLVAVLCGALPLWNPPSVPSALHELRLWGAQCAFSRKMLGTERTGPFLVRTLLSDAECVANTASTGGHYLLDSPYGIRVVETGTLDAVEYRGEAHYGQLLKIIGQIGISSKAQVTTSSSRVGDVRDLYQDAVLRFSLDRELEFIGCALAYWHPPQATWRDQFGHQFSFDDIIEALVTKPFGKGACGGTHIPYTVVTILRADSQFSVLSAAGKQHAEDWLIGLSHRLEDRQSALGGWDRSWSGGDGAEFVYGDDLLDRITITGHHLEWMALVPDGSMRPGEAVIDRAVSALRRDTDSLVPIEHRSFKTLLPVSHAARALALFRNADPFTVWSEYWKAGRLVWTKQGYTLARKEQ